MLCCSRLAKWLTKKPRPDTNTRILTEEDFPRVEELFRESFPQFDIKDLNITWEYRSRNDCLGILDELTGERLIGFIIASYHAKNHENMYIDYIAFEEAARGKGLGTKLLQNILRTKYQQRSSVHLSPANDALVDWYMKHGFNQSTERYYVFHSYGTRKQIKGHTMLGLE